MKKILSILFATMLVGQTMAANYSFSAECSSGQTLYYKITSNVEPYMVNVTYPQYNSNNWNYYYNHEEPTGDLTIPETVTNNGITYNVTRISAYAFQGCSRLTSVTIPNTVTDIDDYAFCNCDGLTSVDIPNSVTRIGNQSFWYCTSLTTVIIPNSVTQIYTRAFSNCDCLTSIIIPNSVTYIANYAFADSKGLESISLPNSISRIDGRLFLNCTGLKHVVIPESVKSIDVEAFTNCASLESIDIPKSIESINITAFKGCSSLTNFGVDSENQYFTDENGVLFNKNKTVIIKCPNGKVGSYTIPNTVTTIGNMAFEGCDSLTSIIIPESVTSIGGSAFQNCTSLTTIDIPNSVTSIDDGAFSNCTELSSIILPNDIINIGTNVFKECNKLRFNEYDNAKYLGSNENPYLFLVAAKSYDITSCIINNNCKIIDGYVFNYFNKLKSITIPNSVLHIGNYAFAGCNIEILVYNTNVALSYEYSYYSDSKQLKIPTEKLKTIIIGDSIKSINNEAFDSSVELKNVISTPSIPPVLNGDPFIYTDTIYVRPNNTDIYMVTDVWKDKIIMPFYYVRVNSINESIGFANCDSLLLGNHSVIATATPKEGFHFVMWSDSVTDNPRVYSAASDTAFTAIFEAHTCVIDSAMAATCTTTGLTEGKHCSVCGEVLVAQTEIPALGHEFSNYIFNNDATTTADGTETAKCEHGCGTTNTRTAVGTKRATAISESAADNLQVHAHGNTIIVENATAEIRVYDAMGRMIGRDAINRVRTEIRVNTTGVYIVKVGNVAKRVMVND